MEGAAEGGDHHFTGGRSADLSETHLDPQDLKAGRRLSCCLLSQVWGLVGFESCSVSKHLWRRQLCAGH